MDFLMSIITGIVSSVIVSCFIWIGQKIIRTRYYSDIARVYNTKESGFKAINNDMRQASEVKTLAVRGQSLIDKNAFSNLWDTENCNRKIEIIISDIDNQKLISQRSKANCIGEDTYKKGIEIVLKELTTKQQIYQNLTLLTHTTDLSFKLFIMDHCMYVLYYQNNKNVNKSRIVKYKSDTGAYMAFQHYYDSIKSNSSIKIYNTLLGVKNG